MSPGRRSRQRLTASVCAALAVGAMLSLSGCSVVEGLAIQGNLNVIYLSTAATDVLLSQGISIRVKPVCQLVTKELQSYACAGTTSDGRPIDVSVADGTVADPIMVVSVGGKQVFTGSVTGVIKRNAEKS